MTTIEQNLTATGYIIVIHSDVPSHLWMRWTVTLPQEHLIQRTKRGLAFLVDKYFCFDVYHDNEQEEAGDTLVHTFIKEPWPVCETRYFYFHGEISGVPSKSTTTIFKKHRLAPPPVYTIDREVLISSDDASAIFSTTWFSLTSVSVWTGAYNASYYSYGSGMRFQDIAIPPGSTIDEAHLILTSLLNAPVPAKSEIHAEAVDSAPTFANNRAAFDDRRGNVTAALVLWDDPDWDYDVAYDSPDIKAIIQELINRPGWLSGNDIVLFWDDLADRTTHYNYRAYASSFEGVLDPPKIHIKYTPP